MEAGNRCYDDHVPEEVNRRVIDHSSTILMPYTQRSRENLLREGVDAHRIYVTGNPILEVIEHYDAEIRASKIHSQLGVEPGRFVLVTMHRAENVDVESRLRNLALALHQVQQKYGCPVICSLHPRTKDRMRAYGVGVDNDLVRFTAPLGFFDFVSLERSALCALSDSGTVQEECCIFRVEPDSILRCMETVLTQPPAWTPPVEYLAKTVSSTVMKIVLGGGTLVS